ncbi:MAG: ATP-dependent helicase, partial [Verrucomicrobiae bacterium]|nr:ATP-dependent helicase [Verrucomicrobiae bacterium]
IDPEPTVTADDAPRGTPPSPVRTAKKGRKKRPPATGDPAAAAASSRLATALQGITAEVPKKAVTAWAQFTATVAQLEAPDVGDRPDTMLGLALEGAYEDYLQSKYTNYVSRRDDIEQLAAFARQFDGLPEFLGQLALLTNVDADTREGRPDDEERLRLSTVHQAKGLEFKVVFVMMLCEGLFPSGRSSETPEGVEEERRLFYVAITRAKDELYLSY